jgi:hypothetical protein
MTLRPFKITNTKSFLIRIQDHRGTDLIVDKSIKTPKNFYKKLLSYPITAFGYSICHPPENKELPNPKFDRTDVIKALDFWIEHWVYQNKKDYILEGTVNKDFELTVRELIETREAVLKMPADTQFVRQKIRVSEVGTQYKYEDLDDITKIPEFVKDRIVEFTENVLDGGNSVSSTVDQFCYVVRKTTYKEYIQHNKPKLYNKDIAQSLFGISGDFSAIMDELTRRIINQVPVPTGDIQRAASFANENTVVGTAAETFNPGISTEEPEAIGMMGEEGIMTELIGTAGENLIIGDLIYRDDNNMRWYRARPINPLGSQGVRIVVRAVSEGQMIEGVREGTFIYPPGTIVSLIPGSTHLGFDAHENVIVRRDMRNPSSTEQEIRTTIERGRLLGLNERQIRVLIELMRERRRR